MEHENYFFSSLLGDPITLASVAASPTRRTVSLGETVDDLLSGGLAAGEMLLITGPPGIGKSRLAMGILRDFCQLASRPALYVATRGELRVSEVIRLAASVGAVDCGVHVVELDSIDAVCAHLGRLGAERGPVPVVIDSVLGLLKPWEQEDGLRRLRDAAGDGDVVLIVLAGNQPSGAAAGPRSPLHVPDGVISMRLDDDPDRRLITLCKYRFGPSPRYKSLSHTSAGLVPSEELSDELERDNDDDDRTASAAEARGHAIAVVEDCVLAVSVVGD